jgi:CheY-like chemotaxis protein
MDRTLSGRRGATLKQTVLLVDDSRFLRMATGRALEKAGYKVIAATDGEQALHSAVESTPDVIVLDMMLPKLSGPQVLRALKQDPGTAAIPVIVLSSLPQVNESKLKTEGAARYFEKSRLDIENGCPALTAMVEALLESCGLGGG